MSVRMDSGEHHGARHVLRRGLEVSPELVQGVWVTLVLAVLASAGRIVVPIAVQQTVDTVILAAGTGALRPARACWSAAPALALVVTGVCTALVNVRLFRSSEAGLARLRVTAFRRVHDLSALTQGTERRGSLVSRVTSDVDTISLFVQWGGIMLLVSVLQLAAATALMAVWSWQLTLAVWAAFLPLLLVLRPAQRKVSAAYARVRESVGAMLGAVSEAVVGAETVRAYGVAERTQRRIDDAISATRNSQVGAQTRVATVFSAGVFVANAVLAVVVVAGTLLGIGGSLTAGRLLGFLFLVQLFTGPVQMATEILNELQNALAGWRRVLGVIDTEVEIADPHHGGVPTATGPAQVALEGVDFAYPDGPTVLHDVHLEVPARTKVAVVGATGSGKTTLAKLVTRLVDPARGRVLLDGVDLRDLSLTPAARAAWSWCRRRASCSTARWPTTCLRRARRGDAPTSRRSSPSWAWRTGWRRCPTAWARRSASAASGCRRGSASWSRSPARTWPVPTCWSSTRRPAPSTPRPRSASPTPWTS